MYTILRSNAVKRCTRIEDTVIYMKKRRPYCRAYVLIFNFAEMFTFFRQKQRVKSKHLLFNKIKNKSCRPYTIFLKIFE